MTSSSIPQKASHRPTTEQRPDEVHHSADFASPQLRSDVQQNGTSQKAHSKELSFSSNFASGIGQHDLHVNSVTSNPYHQHGADVHPVTFPTEPMWHDYGLQQHSGDTTQLYLPFDDLMTPEYSENHISDHTTPQEQIWEQQFISNNTEEPHIVDEPHQGTFSSPDFSRSLLNGLGDISPASKLQETRHAPGSQLLSPQFTTPSPPAHKARVIAEQQDRETPTLPNMNGAGTKRPAGNLSVATNSETVSRFQPESQHSRSSPPHRAISPMVIVSSHGNDDLQASSRLSRRPSTGKRGRQDLPQDVPSQEYHDYSKRLMPPDAFDMEPREDDQGERAGLDPSQRDAKQVASVNEIADMRKLDERNAEVEDWLSRSDAGSTGDSVSPHRARRRAERPRAHSTGIKVDTMGLPVYSDRGIPGPGVLVDEDSEDEYSEAGSYSAASYDTFEASSSPPVSEDKLKDAAEATTFPDFEDDDIPPEMQEPLPRQFYRRTPWQDPARGPISNSSQDQPASSNAAAMRFNQEAAKWETASRAATWGTRRRLSESEVSSIVDGSKVRHLSLAKRGRERGNTLLNKVSNLIPRRNSNNTKSREEPSPETPASSGENLPQRESPAPTRPVQRMGSFGKPKSPPLNTGSAFLAMTGNLAAVGHVVPFSTEQDPIKSEGLKSPLQVLRKVRSKSDAGRPQKASPGLAELMSRHGGPPMPTLASPHKEPVQFLAQPKFEDPGADDDDDDLLDDSGVKMDFRIRSEHIVPSYEGFKMHARQLNPRLEPYLIDRIGQEQVRRYKKMLDAKIKHLRAVKIQQKCQSGKFCIDLGGSGELITPRPSTKDPETACAQFQIDSPEDAELDEGTLDEGVMARAQFPPGIPIPPVKRLPAEFECMLCFKVKKFYKPSDWTKHVHEDIQPFSCTFPHCNEPKSFKRKADWVRHENERHRRLEYWKCSVQECNHMCYRKDNFVQHLVREHKKTEPKAKSRGSGSSKARPAQGNPWEEDEEVWRLVESCRFETAQKPRMEPCKFCGNVCNSWKKLSVHMGKHMEQIALPIVELVQMKEVAPDTVISPIEQNYNQQPNMAANMQPILTATVDQASLSPYAISAHSAHHSSSAGQSPVSVQIPVHNQMTYETTYYGPHGMNGPLQDPLIHGERYTSTPVYSATPSYTPTAMSMQDHFGAINTQLAPAYSATQYLPTPVSAQSMHGSTPGGDVFHAASHPGSYDSTQYHYEPTTDAGVYPQYATTADQVHAYGEHPGPNGSSQHYDPSRHQNTSYTYEGEHFGNQGHRY